MFVDIHAHLSFADYDADRSDVVARLKEQRVSLVVNPGTNVQTSRDAIALAEQYEFVYANVGLHPNDVHQITDDDFHTLDALLAHQKVVAVGEIGLDYHYPDANIPKQHQCFREMLRLAKRHDLPVVIHTREAWDDTFKIMQEESSSNLRGAMHCFSGGVEEAKKCLALGFKISIPGIITFKKSTLPDVVAALDIEDLLTETDCPYLAPAPHRGKRNEPSFVVEVAKKIAAVKGLAIETVAETVHQSAAELFAVSQK
ncbi:MAG: hydrolase TatD [[Candidatus Thermochlorobacteriaceae] bacterium GBChlB]|nr:MAG: hydrolase TatD [[Candidatus Thermochlorobacteriaceae] bacterium GBChlB]